MESSTAHILRTPPAPVRGFTLVEMMVVLSIMVIITTISLLGQSTFNRSMVLTDIAYTVAFSIREAQALGISSRRQGTVLDAGYGVHFNSGSAGSYSLFADTNPPEPGDTGRPIDCPGHPNVPGGHPEAKPGNCVQTSDDTIVRSYNLNNGFLIKSFCGTRTSNGQTVCNGTGIAYLDILYLRPNTQSIISGRTALGATPMALSDATIRIQSPDGLAERCIYVSKVGQVSVAQKGGTNCP